MYLGPSKPQLWAAEAKTLGRYFGGGEKHTREWEHALPSFGSCFAEKALEGMDEGIKYIERQKKEFESTFKTENKTF